MEGGGLMIEGRGWRVEGGGLMIQGRGWRVEGGGWRVEGRGSRMEGVAHQHEEGRRRPSRAHRDEDTSSGCDCVKTLR